MTNDASSVRLGEHSLNVVRSGRGDRHFLCLHGLVDDVDVWSDVAPALEARGRVALVDQRGHGASDAPRGPYSRADFASDVVGVLDACGVEQSVLVGHSMGGVVAMATALLAPERVSGLVLIGTTSECREKVAGWYERIALAGESDGVDGLRRAIYGERSRKRIVGDARGIAHVTRMLKSLHAEPLTPLLAQVRCPALLMVGEKDPMGPKASEIIHAALPPGLSTLHVVPGGGHWLHVDAVDQVVSAVDAWLAGDDAAAVL